MIIINAGIKAKELLEIAYENELERIFNKLDANQPLDNNELGTFVRYLERGKNNRTYQTRGRRKNITTMEAKIEKEKV